MEFQSTKNQNRQQGEGGSRKSRYSRHTPEQIQRMEEEFKRDPHPDEKERRALSEELGLDPPRVKFWFQNRRTQKKKQSEAEMNKSLREENERLRFENARLKAGLRLTACRCCGGPICVAENGPDERKLMIENTLLKEQVLNASRIAALFAGGFEG